MFAASVAAVGVATFCILFPAKLIVLFEVLDVAPIVILVVLVATPPVPMLTVFVAPLAEEPAPILNVAVAVVPNIVPVVAAANPVTVVASANNASVPVVAVMLVAFVNEIVVFLIVAVPLV